MDTIEDRKREGINYLIGFVLLLLIISSPFTFMHFYIKHLQNDKSCIKVEPESYNEISVIGFVNTSDGEKCKIEEVSNIYYSKEWIECYDKINRKPLVRRIVCPSGKNGQSAVMDDGTKFHREVLK